MNIERLKKLPKTDTIRKHATSNDLRVYTKVYLDRTVGKELSRIKLFKSLREQGYSYDKADSISRRIL